MAGRATGYSDYYKNNDETPEVDKNKIRVNKSPKGAEVKNPDDMDAARKAAMRRRLLNKKKVGM